jgi:hypothetical protein
MPIPQSRRKNYTDEQIANRLTRLVAFKDGTMPKVAQVAIVTRTLDGQTLEPNVANLASRNEGLKDNKFRPKWRPMSKRVIPDERLPEGMTFNDAGKIIDPDLDNFKTETASDYIGTYYGWHGTVLPEYDMREPMAIVDTEVYVKQAVKRKLDLMFRAGYEILSDRVEDADYIQNRIDIMEFVMGRTWDSFMKSVLRNLLLTSNCFVHKLRKESAAPVPKKDAGQVPVAGYVIIPTHTIQPYLKAGTIVFWRRFFDSGRPYQDIPVEDIIHFKWDVKPGHIFGTPRTVAVRDDIFALRRLEENIELLFINHLFPLFHVNVGNEDAPCTYDKDGASEIDLVKWQIENMPKEGVFVTDERVKVNAVGAKGKSLDPSNLVEHFKSRVYIGLGMSGIDMGEGKDGTRATADNISQNLKDAIKADLDEFAGQIRMGMFKEWFKEANYSTSVQKGTARTRLIFHEIDLDNRIKYENHVINLFNSHLITETYARRLLKLKPIKGAEKKELDRSNLHFDLHVLRLEKEILNLQQANQLELGEADTKNQKALLNAQVKLANIQAKADMVSANAETVKAGAKEQVLAAQATHMPKIAAAKAKINASAAKKAAASGRRPGKPRSGTAHKSTPSAGTTQNRSRPTNQHGTNLGPTRAKSSLEPLESELYTRLLDLQESLVSGGLMSDENWRRHSAVIIDEVYASVKTDPVMVSDGGSYTRQDRTGFARLKAMVGETSDPERLAVILTTGQAESDYVALRDALADEDSQ